MWQASRDAAVMHMLPCHASALLPLPLPLPQAKGQEALVERLTKNVGTAIGLELRDTTQPLNATNTRPVKAGMTFNVAVGGWRGRAADAGASNMALASWVGAYAMQLDWHP